MFRSCVEVEDSNNFVLDYRLIDSQMQQKKFENGNCISWFKWEIR